MQPVALGRGWRRGETAQPLGELHCYQRPTSELEWGLRVAISRETSKMVLLVPQKESEGKRGPLLSQTWCVLPEISAAVLLTSVSVN